jgi:predicted transcriptional regulator
MPSQHRGKAMTFRFPEEFVARVQAAAQLNGGEDQKVLVTRAIERECDRIEQQNGAQSP